MKIETQEQFNKEMTRYGTWMTETLENMNARSEGVDLAIAESKARLLEVEQRLLGRQRIEGGAADGGDPGGAALQALLEGSEGLKSVANRKSRRTVIELPAGFFETKAIVSGGGLAMPGRMQEIVAPVTRRLTIRSLLPSLPTDAGSVQYTREVALTNNASTVSETTLKPESNITFALVTTAIATLATWIRTSAQVLDDTPMLQRYIDNRLRYALAFVEELQLLKGSGVGSNLTGLQTVATAYNRTTVGDNKIDALRRACTQLQDTDFQATGIILHPFDWEAISLIKSTTGEYIVGSPGGANPPTLWNLPVIPTSAQTAGTFLVADFPQAAIILDREEARVDVSTETDDDFTTNQCHIRVEERLGLAIVRTGALIKGTLP